MAAQGHVKRRTTWCWVAALFRQLGVGRRDYLRSVALLRLTRNLLPALIWRKIARYFNGYLKENINKLKEKDNGGINR